MSRLWKHTVSIERYQVVDGQGFNETRPVDAFDIVREGQRHHHYTQVPDGTTRESYTQRVACGQDCRTTPVSCRSNNNGFKTCSGGDRVCSTRYCSEVRYRTVPRYATVSVDEPWYRWRAWQWQPQRVIEKTGSEEPPFWPEEAELALDRGCREGERERAERRALYEVVFANAEHEQHRYKARDADEFRQLAPGTSRTLRIVRGMSPKLVKGDDAQ